MVLTENQPSPLQRLRRSLRPLKRWLKGSPIYTQTKLLPTTAKGENVPLGTGTIFTLDGHDHSASTYKWHEVEREHIVCPTATRLGVKEKVLVELCTKDGRAYAQLVQPDGFGIVYHRMLPTPTWLNNFYDQSYDQKSIEAQSDADYEQERLDNKVEHHCAPFLRPGSKILDIGCGYGDQLVFFKRAGHEVYGVEPGLHRSNFAKERFGIDVVHSEVENKEALDAISQVKGPFDLVFMNQVLEHLVDPVTCMAWLKNLVKEDGYVFISVPDYELENVINKLYSVIHTHAFTRSGLLAAADKSGLELVQDFDTEYYLTMLFRPKRQVESEKTFNVQKGEKEVLRDISRSFCLDRYLAPGDRVEQSSNVLRLWKAEYTYRGSIAPMIKNLKDLPTVLPVRVISEFETPKLLFE